MINIFTNSISIFYLIISSRPYAYLYLHWLLNIEWFISVWVSSKWNFLGNLLHQVKTIINLDTEYSILKDDFQLLYLKLYLIGCDKNPLCLVLFWHEEIFISLNISRIWVPGLIQRPSCVISHFTFFVWLVCGSYLTMLKGYF